jgi:hypothetical protein
MNAVGYDDLAKSRGINLDVELAVGRSDFEAAVRPGNGLCQSLALSSEIVTDELNRSIGQPVPLRVGDSALQRNPLTQERKREPSQPHDKNYKGFPA